MVNNSGEIKALIELIDDPDDTVFKSITDRFVGLGKEVVPIIKEQLDFTDDEATILKINYIIHKVNFNLLEVELLEWNASPQKNLWDATLIISSYIDTEANKKEIQFEIEKVRRSIWLELNDYLTSLEEVNVINKVLFSYYKYATVAQTQTKEIDLGINKLLSTKTGGTRSIATFYLLLAELLKIPIKALQIPNQTLMAYCGGDAIFSEESNDEILFFIDPTTGQVYTHADVENYLKKINHHISTSALKPMSTKAYVIIWLTEISEFYKKNNQQDNAADLIQLAINID